VAEDHDIDIPPVFLSNGKLIPPSQLAVRLPNALVEVMFTLRHYFITEKKKFTASSSRTPAGRGTSNTFTATVEQVKILTSNIDPKKGASKKMATIGKEQKASQKRKQRDDDDDGEEEGRKRAEADSIPYAN
jgi:hypothetical protein